MSILIGRETRVLVQGITGRQGRIHTVEMLKYGTAIVAGVTPGKGGESVEGVPVYNTVYEALREHPEVNTSIVFVPARHAVDAVLEALDGGIKTIVVITEHIPLHDALFMLRRAREVGARVIGPNTPGIISPGKSKVGIMPGKYFAKGDVGIMSRSGTLTYEVSRQLMLNKHGVSTAVGIGGDPAVGMDFIEVYNMFLKDEDTSVVVLVGEIGGTKEERFAEYYSKLNFRKPVVALIAGRSAPPGKRMGHAGALVFGGMGTYDSKVSALEKAGIRVARSIYDVPRLLEEVATC